MIYHVCTGRPTWHQARAGHVCSAVTVCPTRASAEEYLVGCKQYHPDEPAWIVEKPGEYPKPEER